MRNAEAELRLIYHAGYRLRMGVEARREDKREYVAYVTRPHDGIWSVYLGGWESCADLVHYIADSLL